MRSYSSQWALNWSSAATSINLDKKLRLLTGWYDCVINSILTFLRNGLIIATFQLSAKTPSLSNRLTLLVMRGKFFGAISLNSLVGIGSSLYPFGWHFLHVIDNLILSNFGKGVQLTFSCVRWWVFWIFIYCFSDVFDLVHEIICNWLANSSWDDALGKGFPALVLVSSLTRS